MQLDDVDYSDLSVAALFETQYSCLIKAKVRMTPPCEDSDNKSVFALLFEMQDRNYFKYHHLDEDADNFDIIVRSLTHRHHDLVICDQHSIEQELKNHANEFVDIDIVRNAIQHPVTEKITYS